MRQGKTPGAKRKAKRFVLDVNSFVSIFINQETDWLLRYVSTNRLDIFIDNILLDELARVLEYPKIKKILPLDSILYINFVRVVCTQIVTSSFHVLSPDPNDNYLFDIALTANARLLITGDKALLNWLDSPVETIALPEFKKLF